MIPGFPQLGGMELLIILSVILLFFGAKRIPELARSLGKGTREFRKGINEGAEDEAQKEDLREEGREKPSLNARVGEESPQKKETEGAARTEQKA